MVMSWIFTGILILSLAASFLTGNGSALAQAVPNGAQAKALRKASAAGELPDTDAIRAILVPESSTKPRILKIPTDRLAAFFPPNTPPDKMEAEIYEALKAHRNHVK